MLVLLISVTVLVLVGGATILYVRGIVARSRIFFAYGWGWSLHLIISMMESRSRKVCVKVLPMWANVMVTWRARPQVLRPTIVLNLIVIVGVDLKLSIDVSRDILVRQTPVRLLSLILGVVAAVRIVGVFQWGGVHVCVGVVLALVLRTVSHGIMVISLEGWVLDVPLFDLWLGFLMMVAHNILSFPSSFRKIVIHLLGSRLRVSLRDPRLRHGINRYESLAR